jgi:hypothetical protein
MGGSAQKTGLAGSVSRVGAPDGLICAPPAADAVKSYVLPTIVA